MPTQRLNSELVVEERSCIKDREHRAAAFCSEYLLVLGEQLRPAPVGSQSHSIFCVVLLTCAEATLVSNRF
jgi:hypothetical protein